MIDPRICCKFCHANYDKLVAATKVAPQHSGGDEDRPAFWTPVCDMHFEDWYDDIHPSEQLPAFDLEKKGA